MPDAERVAGRLLWDMSSVMGFLRGDDRCRRMVESVKEQGLRHTVGISTFAELMCELNLSGIYSDEELGVFRREVATEFDLLGHIPDEVPAYSAMHKNGVDRGLPTTAAQVWNAATATTYSFLIFVLDPDVWGNYAGMAGGGSVVR